MIETSPVHLLQLLNRFRNDEEGAALVEYGMLVGLIAVVCILAVTTLGTTVNAVFGAINTALLPLL
jgi:pilus assembly protein Flp/PilA